MWRPLSIARLVPCKLFVFLSMILNPLQRTTLQVNPCIYRNPAILAGGGRGGEEKMNRRRNNGNSEKML